MWAIHGQLAAANSEALCAQVFMPPKTASHPTFGPPLTAEQFDGTTTQYNWYLAMCGIILVAPMTLACRAMGMK